MQNEIKAIVQAEFKNVYVEGDNKIIIQAVQGRIKVPWKIQTLLQDINTSSQCCNQVTISLNFLLS